jgi:RNA polymerase sigma-70 factor, ECF subfamily
MLSSDAMDASDAHRTINAIWRIEAPRLIARLMRIVRDVGVAQELAQDALVAALEQWPQAGVPENPGAWLMATAKHLAINVLNRQRLMSRKHERLSHESDAMVKPDLDAAIDNDIGDDLLRLMFIACHPILSAEARVALTLRLLGGLTTEEIARAFLASEQTIAQRIVRAKRTLSEGEVPFEVPRGPERASRLSSVLEVIYLVFNEGYSATSGDDWTRPELCNDALRLGRMLAELTPLEPEVQALVALMEMQGSRFGARTGPSGEPIPLMEQNRAKWDYLLIERGLTTLARVERLDGTKGPYALQAAISGCHATARVPEETNWQRIAALYQELMQVMPSPIVELNRAVAVGWAFGPEMALDILEPLREIPSLKNTHLLPAVRGDLLAKLGRWAEAHEEFERAASLTKNAPERTVLVERAQKACDRMGT